MSSILAVLSLWLAALPGAGWGAVPTPGPSDVYPRLTIDFQPLRSVFNEDAGRVRLLLLLDPT